MTTTADDRTFRDLTDEQLTTVLGAARHSASVNPAGSDAHVTAKSVERKVLAERAHRDGDGRAAMTSGHAPASYRAGS